MLGFVICAGVGWFLIVLLGFSWGADLVGLWILRFCVGLHNTASEISDSGISGWVDCGLGG